MMMTLFHFKYLKIMNKDLIRTFLLIVAIYSAIWASNIDYVWWSRLINSLICGACSAYFVILERKNKE